jgi:hypothetical protein
MNSKELENVQLEIVNIQKKIELAEKERLEAKDKLSSIPDSQPTSKYEKLLDSATQELNRLSQKELKLIEQRTVLMSQTAGAGFAQNETLKRIFKEALEEVEHETRIGLGY